MRKALKDKVLWLLVLARDVALMPLIFLCPRRKNKVLFGSWGGKQFSCNPRYLFEYCCRRGGLNCVWIGEEYLRKEVTSVPGARFARRGSLAAFYHFMTARFFVHNVQWRDDLLNIPRCKRALLIYLTHGYPDKKTGSLQLNGSGLCDSRASACESQCFIRKYVRRFLVALDEFLYGQAAWCSVNSEQGAQIRLTNMAFRFTPDRILNFGTPRADYFLAAGKDMALKTRLREKYKNILGLPLDKKWYIFVPTWRHEKEYLYSFQTSPRLQEFQRVLQGQNAVLIEKQHPKTLEELGIAGGRVGDIVLVSTDQARKIDTQELLMACDLLITDYSSVYYDYVLMDRPVIHYAYDFDHFMNIDMGFNFDIRDYGGGPFVYKEDELLACMKKSFEELLAARNRTTKDIQLSYEKGCACEGYYNFMIEQSKKQGYLVP